MSWAAGPETGPSPIKGLIAITFFCASSSLTPVQERIGRDTMSLGSGADDNYFSLPDSIYDLRCCRWLLIGDMKNCTYISVAPVSDPVLLEMDGLHSESAHRVL